MILEDDVDGTTNKKVIKGSMTFSQQQHSNKRMDAYLV